MPTMNRDVYFGYNPTVNIKRSRFDMSYRIHNAFNAGDLVPLGDCIEVYPGDTFTVDMNCFLRMTPTIDVPADDILCDVWWFFVPYRLVWTHWKEFCGENNADPWTSTSVYRIPQIKLHSSGTPISIPENSILSHMGIPSGVLKITSSGVVATSVNALKVRSYVSVWNEFFRDENYQYPVLLQTGDSDVTFASSTGVNRSDSATGRSLLPLNRFHDYFSSCLPQPQFGDPVRIPTSDTLVLSNGQYSGAAEFTDIGGMGLTVPSINPNVENTTAFIDPLSMGTIDQFRIAYLAQRYLWQLGTYGHRYVEIIKGFFGVTAPDYLLNRPLLLGTTRFNINISPVVQTAAAETTTYDGQTYNSAKGSVSGYSSTRYDDSLFTRSFVEHGYLVPLIGIRTHRSYCQGINPSWFRRDFLDFYNPIFANIGSQPVYTKYLYAGDSSHTVADNTVFGYNEAWAELRYNNDLTTGMLRSTLAQRWTFSDIYSSAPTFSDSWVSEGKANINRTLYVLGTDSVPQFIGDFYIKMVATRPMPLHSVPGISPHL